MAVRFVIPITTEGAGMTMLDSDNRYGAVSRVIHWSMALLLLLMLSSDLWMHMYKDITGQSAMPIHQGLGIVLTILLVFRLIWRGINMDRVQPPEHWRKAARLGHMVLYGLMLIIPLSGLIMAGSSGHGIDFFGVNLVAGGERIEWLKEGAEEVHELAANLLWFVVAGHVIAALAHQYYLGDHTIRRMT